MALPGVSDVFGFLFLELFPFVIAASCYLYFYYALFDNTKRSIYNYIDTETRLVLRRLCSLPIWCPLSSSRELAHHGMTASHQAASPRDSAIARCTGNNGNKLPHRHRHRPTAAVRIMQQTRQEPLAGCPFRTSNGVQRASFCFDVDTDTDIDIDSTIRLCTNVSISVWFEAVQYVLTAHVADPSALCRGSVTF